MSFPRPGRVVSMHAQTHGLPLVREMKATVARHVATLIEWEIVRADGTRSWMYEHDLVESIANFGLQANVIAIARRDLTNLPVPVLAEPPRQRVSLTVSGLEANDQSGEARESTTAGIATHCPDGPKVDSRGGQFILSGGVECRHAERRKSHGPGSRIRADSGSSAPPAQNILYRTITGRLRARRSRVNKWVAFFLVGLAFVLFGCAWMFGNQRSQARGQKSVSLTTYDRAVNETLDTVMWVHEQKVRSKGKMTWRELNEAVCAEMHVKRTQPWERH